MWLEPLFEIEVIGGAARAGQFELQPEGQGDTLSEGVIQAAGKLGLETGTERELAILRQLCIGTARQNAIGLRRSNGTDQ